MGAASACGRSSATATSLPMKPAGGREHRAIRKPTQFPSRLGEAEEQRKGTTATDSM